jgi:hypothetical protein
MYVGLGLAPIPVPYREKNPNRKDWQNERITQDTVDEHFPHTRRGNLGVLNGEPSGNLADVDLDCQEAIQAAALLLPATGWVFGRRSKLRAHWLYRTDAALDKASEKMVDLDNKSVLVELRGTGGQTLFPPSFHPEGEPITWESFTELANVELASLLQSVRAVAAAALLAHHWPAKGSRDAAALALTGGLVRAGWSEERVSRFCRAVATAAGDEEAAARAGKAGATSEKHAVGKKTTGWPTLEKLLRHRGPEVVHRVREWLGAGGDSCKQVRTPGVSATTIITGDQPTVCITTQEHEVNRLAATTLANDRDLFQRGGLLVRVLKDTSPASGAIRRAFTPRIDPLPSTLLRERLSAVARWVVVNKKGEELPAHPPAWSVAAVHARAHWPGVRHLEAVVEYPILRPDGTVLCSPGHDQDTGLLLAPAGELPSINEFPTLDNARDAIAELMEVVADFPFESEIHRAAWFAGLLTPLARFAFTGAAPLFLMDSNVRGSGKGLLLDCISRIITGERFTVATYTDDQEELRKPITSLALAGDRLVLFDNLAGKFGNSVLDAALTATSWKDRLLGINRMGEAPLYMTWYATGNNVSIAADTARRVYHVRLESPLERPEERRGFRHPNLLRWVGRNRPRLLAAALTILRAYFVAGKPDLALPPWGSFEGWSAVVRNSLVWASLPDPAQTRQQLQDHADAMAEAMGMLLSAWEQLDRDGYGMTTADLIERVKDHRGTEPHFAAMRDAIETMVGKLDARALGYKLRSYRRRVFQGRFLDLKTVSSGAKRWAVFPANQFAAGNNHRNYGNHRNYAPTATSGDGCDTPAPVETSADGDGCDGCHSCDIPAQPRNAKRPAPTAATANAASGGLNVSGRVFGNGTPSPNSLGTRPRQNADPS